MALLKPSAKADKTQIRINVDSKIVGAAKAYCNFAGIKKPDEFFDKAAEFVMKKNRGWKKNNFSETSEITCD